MASMRRKQPRGVTLIEMMVVIAISGLLSTLAVVTLRDTLVAKREMAAARSISALIKRARVDAIARHRRVRIDADISAHSVNISSCKSIYGGQGCATGESLTSSTFAPLRLNDGALMGVKLTSVPATALVFDAAGFPEVPGTYTYGVDQVERPGSLTVVVTTAGEIRVQ